MYCLVVIVVLRDVGPLSCRRFGVTSRNACSDWYVKRWKLQRLRDIVMSDCRRSVRLVRQSFAVRSLVGDNRLFEVAIQDSGLARIMYACV